MATSSNSGGIDPRGPRFGAGITATLMLVTIGLGLQTPLAQGGIVDRAGEPAFHPSSTPDRPVRLGSVCRNKSSPLRNSFRHLG